MKKLIMFLIPIIYANASLADIDLNRTDLTGLIVKVNQVLTKKYLIKQQNVLG